MILLEPIFTFLDVFAKVQNLDLSTEMHLFAASFADWGRMQAKYGGYKEFLVFVNASSCWGDQRKAVFGLSKSRSGPAASLSR